MSKIFYNLDMSPESRPANSDDTGKPRFRSKLAFDQEFNAIVKQLGYEPPIAQEVEDEEQVDGFLNLIADMGVQRAAAAIAQTRETNKGPYVPADPTEVKAFLYEEVSIDPPLRFNDLGSLDKDIIVETRLSQQHYEDELRELITYLDPTKAEVSVLEFPKLRREIDEIELEAWKKILITQTLEIHGISLVFDKNDMKAWNDLKGLSDEIASYMFRDYSRKLRQRASTGRRTPIRDVIDNIDEWRANRERAFEIARENSNATPHEIKRMFETMPPHLRELVEGYLEDFRAYRQSQIENDEL